MESIQHFGLSGSAAVASVDAVHHVARCVQHGQAPLTIASMPETLPTTGGGSGGFEQKKQPIIFVQQEQTPPSPQLDQNSSMTAAGQKKNKKDHHRSKETSEGGITLRQVIGGVAVAVLVSVV